MLSGISLSRRTLTTAAWMLLLAFIATTIPASAHETTYPLTIENCGRSLTFEAAPERVLTTWQAPPELLVKLGVGDRIIGTQWAQQFPPPAEIADEYNALPVLAEQGASKEAVLAANPDFILSSFLIWDFDPSTGAPSLDDVEAAGIKVFGLNDNCTAESHVTYEDMYEDILTIGRIFDVQHAAEELVEDMQARVAAVQERIAGLTPIKVFFDAGGEGPVGTAGAGLQDDQIRLAGGENIFADHANYFESVSLEEIAARQPEIFVVDTWDDPTYIDSRIQWLFTTFSETPAAKNQRYVEIPGIYIYFGSIRFADGIEMMAKAFHPEAFTDETVLTEPTVTALLEDLPAAEPDMNSFPVTVNNCERELTFDAPPERIISLWQPPTEILLALGVADRFVALAGSYAPYPDSFTEIVAAIPEIGTGMQWPSREVLLSQQPDFVISEGLDSFGYDPAQGYATVEEIEASGAVVYALAACYYLNPETTPRNIDRVLSDIHTLGTIFGVSERAEALIKRMEAQREAVVTAVAGREPVRVAFYNGGQGPLFVLNSSMWADLLVTAGGESVFDPTAFQVSVEEFAAADPEVILMGTYPGQSAEDLSTFLQTTFPTVSAVQNGRLYPIETINVENSIRIMYGLETIAKALHPDAFADSTAEATPAPVVTAHTQYPVTIETCGRTITVNAPPQRVYTTYWNGFDLLARLGLADRVVGNAYQGDYDGGELAEQYAQIPNQYEGYPAAEEALALQADLVIASYDTFDFPPETLSIEDWSASGTPVYSMSTECGGGDATQAHFEMFFDDVRNIGIIFDVQTEAEALIAEMQGRLDAVQSALGDTQPVTAMIYYGGEGPLNVFTNGVYGSIIELAGGQTIFPDAERTVEEASPEVIAALAPQAYLIIPWTDTFDNLRTFLYLTFPDAPATTNDNAILMPDGTTPAGYRTVEAIEQLAQLLHPDAFE